MYMHVVLLSFIHRCIFHTLRLFWVLSSDKSVQTVQANVHETHTDPQWTIILVIDSKFFWAVRVKRPVHERQKMRRARESTQRIIEWLTYQMLSWQRRTQAQLCQNTPNTEVTKRHQIEGGGL